MNFYYALKNTKTGRYFVDFKYRKIRTTFSCAFAERFTCKFTAKDFIEKQQLIDYIVVLCNVSEEEVVWK